MEQENQTSGSRRPRAAARILAALLAVALVSGLSGPVSAAEAGETESRTLIPVGRAVGIKLFADGVMVVGLAQGNAAGEDTPARACGLRTGDVITHINSEEVTSIEEVQQMLQETGGQEMTIRAVRGDKQIQLTAVPAETEQGTYQLGAWIRDSMAGIGTVTWYDPATGCFAALGHGISDVDTGILMPLESGSIMYATVSGGKKGIQGTPGQLQGTFQVNNDLGTLVANTGCGIYGQLTDETMLQGLEPMEVASRSEVKVGPAVILSNIAGDQVEEYQVEIVRVYPDGEDSRDLMLQVTDPRLLETTGGIVQGMSGSPILQDGRLVGAVTHVLVNDPTKGYGILAQRMLEQAERETQNSTSM